MKPIRFTLSASVLLTLVSCYTTTPVDQVISQKYVHKYGFDVSEQEWEERSQDGQEIAVLKNGVKITRSYENGQLHGPTTYTFPRSDKIEKALVYDQGTLLKETLYDRTGLPLREDLYEFDNRNVITLWDNKGVPLSIEEYQNGFLTDGKYYTPDHVLEAQVEMGFGEKIKRDVTGQLMSKDKMEEGIIVEKTTYHPNGEPHTISHYDNDQLHGVQYKFSASGKPLMELSWNHGVLDGFKVVYRNGLKVADIPYANGKKQGIERHYDDLGNLTAEIEWREDKKHGSSKFYSEETTDVEWFYQGQTVNADKFQMLDNRERFSSVE